jgi:hypothetical protein
MTRAREARQARPLDVPAAIRTHRLDYWTWVAEHAVPASRDILCWLRDRWREWNQAYFAGALLEPYITLTEPSAPKLYGQCCPDSSWGSRLEIRLRPSLLAGTHPHVGEPAEGRRRLVADIVLHEMIHQWQVEVSGAREPSYHGHGPTFCAQANRIGATLGLPAVIVRNRGGSRELVCAHWPHCVRDRAYYLGAYGPDVHHRPVTTSRGICPHCHGTGYAPRARVQAIG